MNTGRLLFVSSSVFSLVIAIVYWLSSHEYAGTILLGLMTGALVFAAGYTALAERKACLVGDRPDASNADAKGEKLGVFTRTTPWPIVTAFGAFMLLAGLAIFPFAGILGGAMLFFGLYGLVRESR